MSKTGSCRFLSTLQELHFCRLDSQGTVYSLTKLALEREYNRILAAPHKGTIMCVGFQHSQPYSKSMSFTYIPGDAEIVSIDSLNQKPGIGSPVIGVAFMKVSRQRRESSGRSLMSYFNVYSELGTNVDPSLDKITQGCKSIELGFLPYQLYHTDIYDEESGSPMRTVFLISGSDERIHMYTEVTTDGTLSSEYEEVDIKSHFIELSDVPGVVTFMQCLNLPAINRRLTLIGCKSGVVAIHVVNLFKNELLESHTYSQDSTITSGQIFTLQPYGDKNPPDISDFHVLITSAFDGACVAREAFQSGFTSITNLKKSNEFDSILCSLVTDIDLDGEMEILIGCYGQKLLMYKLGTPGKSEDNVSMCSQISKSQSERVGRQERSSSAILLKTTPWLNSTSDQIAASFSNFLPQDSSDPLSSSDKYVTASSDNISYNSSASNLNPTKDDVTYKGLGSHEGSDLLGTGSSIGNGGMDQSCNNFEFTLWDSKEFPDPVMALNLVDLTSDLIQELVVMTQKGVHILQQEMGHLVTIFQEQLAKVEKFRDKDPDLIAGEVTEANSEDCYSKKILLS